jgi:hypothetical protein
MKRKSKPTVSYEIPKEAHTPLSEESEAMAEALALWNETTKRRYKSECGAMLAAKQGKIKHYFFQLELTNLSVSKSNDC